MKEACNKTDYRGIEIPISKKYMLIIKEDWLERKWSNEKPLLVKKRYIEPKNKEEKTASQKMLRAI